MTAQAWGAFGEKQWDKVEALADNAARQWGDAARKDNQTLEAYPVGDKAKAHALLNELATLTWLKGEALRSKGDSEGAVAAYKTVVADYGFGQTWDTQGWWWQPAAASRDRIAELAPDEAKSMAIELETEPLPARLQLSGKKGICFPFSNPAKQNLVPHNLPRTKAVRPYWNYSWGMNRIKEQPDDIAFLPMVWGAWGKEALAGELAKNVQPQVEAGQAKWLLGFNEPDYADQANMPVEAALTYWPQLEAMGIPLCSPACANPLSDVDDSTQGVRGTWMRDFMREADKRKLRVDAIGVHWYGSPSPASFKQRMIQAYKAYGERPLIISEFAVADWSAKTREANRMNPAEVLAFMKDVLPWMERQNWIVGYSWFSFEASSEVGWPSALFDADGRLTACGRFYKSITNENPDGDQ